VDEFYEQQVSERITLRAHHDESAVTDLMCFSLHYGNSGGGRDGDENLRVKKGNEIYRI